MAQRRGMTLVEAVLALSLTAVIGLVATGVTVAMLDLRESTDTYNQNMQSARTSLAQLQDTIRRSRLIITGNDHSMVLWLYDQKDPGKVNAEEVARLYYSAADNAVMMWEVDLEGVAEPLRTVMNVRIPLDEAQNLNSLNKIVAVSNQRTRAIATDLKSISFRYDTEQHPCAHVVAIDATFAGDRDSRDEDDDQDEAHIHTAVTLRTPQTSPDELAEAGYTGATP